MNTFLIDYDLSKNFTYLDEKRLFKQLLESYQILNTLVNNKKSWSNHPAVKQWHGHEKHLFSYIYSCQHECIKRNIAPESKIFGNALSLFSKIMDSINQPPPIWWGREDIINSHKSRLLCKGEIDSLCAAIKSKLKIKNLNNWIKERFDGKEKNQLKYKDINILNNYVVLADAQEFVKPNHYAQFGWTTPYNLEYIWPVK